MILFAFFYTNVFNSLIIVFLIILEIIDESETTYELDPFFFSCHPSTFKKHFIHISLIFVNMFEKPITIGYFYFISTFAFKNILFILA